MNSRRAPHVIVTGGSSGIGAAIAGLYVDRGANVSLIARTESKLAEQKRILASRLAGNGQRIHAESADVCDAAAIERAIAACETELGACDILVASAGMVDPAPFDALSAERFNAQIETNLIGVANSVRAVLASMKARQSGRLLLIGSGAGIVGLFGYAAYCASKAGLIAFAEAIRQEVHPHGVVVSICLPPDTDTPQLAAELRSRPAESAAIMGTSAVMTVDAVASAAVRGLDRGRPVTYPSAELKLLASTYPVFGRLLRAWFDGRIAKAMR